MFIVPGGIVLKIDLKKRRVHSLPVVKQVKKVKGRFGFSLLNFLVMSALFISVGFFVFNIGKSILDSVELYYNNRELEARINDLYYEKEVLLEAQENLLSDAEIELMAKDKLGLIKPGEVVYILENIN
ncbi:MAG: hypothetical protein FD141_472 [Fusobacteria bacterium]|nr:MAG: hypothetical protein FD141_472 [Fusobacteriota bacterium]KAF0228863.1 MAG: hypothetical protein FD182_1119 [Fusobacteriota bacterium]